MGLKWGVKILVRNILNKFNFIIGTSMELFHPYKYRQINSDNENSAQGSRREDIKVDFHQELLIFAGLQFDI